MIDIDPRDLRPSYICYNLLLNQAFVLGHLVLFLFLDSIGKCRGTDEVFVCGRGEKAINKLSVG